MKPDTLIFLHIYKTGGTSLRDILIRQYTRKHIFWLSTHLSAEKFTSLSPQKKEKIQLLHGHMQFGLHTHFSSPARYVSVVRNPMARILSEYYYNISNPSFGLSRKMTEAGIKSPVEMVESALFPIFDNGQVRLISGNFSKPFGSVDESDFNQAKENILAHFDFIATLEHFDEMVLCMSQAYGWPLPYYLKMNRTRAQKQELSESEKQRILHFNQWDEKLCQWVKERMQEQILQQDETFPQCLADFRLNNERKRNWLRLKAQWNLVLGKRVR